MILFISNSIGEVGGSSYSAIDVILALLKSGKEVAVLTPSKQINLSATVNGKLNEAKWYKIAKRVPPLKEIEKRNIKLLVKWFIYNIQDYFIRSFYYDYKKLESDLTFINGLGSYALYKKFEKTADKKTFIIIRESPDIYDKEKDKNEFNGSLNALKAIPNSIFVSSNIMFEWKKYINNDSVVYIPNCCNEEVAKEVMKKERHSAKSDIGFTEEYFNAVCVSNIRARKGHMLLIDKFEDIKKIVPNIKLYFVGKEINHFAKKLKKKIKLKKIEEDILFLGHRNDTMKIIYASDLIILPSFTEAMPRVILEAMVLRTPVIATDVGGITELIEHKVNGLLFKPHQPETIIDCFNYLIDKKENKNKLTTEASKKYWNNFSRSHLDERYLTLLKRYS